MLKVIRYWDDIDDEEVLGTFSTYEKASAAIEKDFDSYGSKIFLREHVLYRVEEINVTQES